MSASTAQREGLLQSAKPQRRVPGRPFPKGVSGNPGGRAKPGSLDIAALARSHAPEAIEALVRGLKDPKHYVHAAQVLLDRGFGKPQQTLAVDGVMDHWSLHLLAARAIAQELQAERQTIDGTVRDTRPVELPADLTAPALE
jgi:hypothetical protein